MRISHAIASTILLTLAAGSVHAQWTVTNLHPSGAASSQCIDGSLGQQVGSVSDAIGNVTAGFWTGTAASYTSLHPAGSDFSQATGCTTGIQVGHASFGDLIVPGFWTGTAGSFTDLTPPGGFVGSVALCADGNQQGGEVTILTDQYFGHACVWTSSAASFVDLHPTHVLGAENSTLNGMGDGQQVGWTDFNEHSYTAASLWTGTSLSWVNLNPPGITIGYAWAADGGQQVGNVYIEPSPGSDLESHASLWSGTAASWVDLHPVGVISSGLSGISGAHQAGSIIDLNGANHAGYWNGTAASFVDLHTFVPPGYEASYVASISTDATTIYVAGSAITNGGLEQHAMLWTRPINTACPADLDDGSGNGSPDGGVDINDLLFFLTAFEAGGAAADLDNGSGNGVPDGGVDINDLLFFLTHFEAGC